MRSGAGRVLLLVVAVVVLFTVACGRPPRASRASPSPTEDAAAGPAIKITSPRPGESVRAGDLAVTFTVRGVSLVGPEAARGPDDDHVDVFLDGDVSKYLSGETAVPAGTDRILHTAEGTVTFRDVSPGSHVITVLLTTSGHTAVRPRVWDSVTVLAQ